MYRINLVVFLCVSIDEFLASPSVHRSESFTSTVIMSNETNEVGNRVKFHKYSHKSFEIIDKQACKNAELCNVNSNMKFNGKRYQIYKDKINEQARKNYAAKKSSRYLMLI